jgi:ferredoxin
MGLFFVELSRAGILVIGVLVLASVFVQGAWCRYLCPYGALLGFFSWLSPTRISRNPDSCVSCGLCDRACMARLAVSQADVVQSPECTGCLDCIAACPVAGALDLKTLGRRAFPPLRFAVAVVGLFLAGYLGARVTGRWANEIEDREYVERIQDIHSGAYTHPGR